MFVMSNHSIFAYNASVPQAKQTYIPDTRVQVPSFSRCIAFGWFDSDLGFFIYPKSYFMSNQKSNQTGEAHAEILHKLEQTVTDFFNIQPSKQSLKDLWAMLKLALSQEDGLLSQSDRINFLFIYERLNELLPELENLSNQINQLQEEN